MPLGFQTCRSALLLLGRPRAFVAAHQLTSVENGEQILRDVINGSVAVDSVKQPLFFVPGRKRRGLFMIGRESVQDRRFVVVRSSLFLVVSTAAAIRWNGIEGVVVNSSATAAGRTAADTLHNTLIGHLNGENVRDVGHVSEGGGLGYGPRETIEHHAVRSVGLVDSVFDEREDHIVRDKFPSVHVALRIQADGRSRFHSSPQHVPRGNLGKTRVFHDALRLRAFSCAGGTKQHDAAHGGWTASTLSILTNHPCRFNHSWP